MARPRRRHRSTARAPVRSLTRGPHRKQVERRGGVTVWQVDGAYVRQKLDSDFTNFAHHGTCDFVPADEIWLDVEADPDEMRFFIAHARAELRALAAGKTDEEARRIGCIAERRMRSKTGDLTKVRGGAVLPQPVRCHVEIWKKLDNGVAVWLVDGRLTRSSFDVEFTNGGHDHVYEFIPPGEVWIDDDVPHVERPFVLLHELHERNLMKSGIPYEKAHASAAKLEMRYRRRPSGLHEALADEGWE